MPAAPLQPPAGTGPWAVAQRHAQPLAVLFDRDGTLVTDVPYNGDPAAVRLVPGAAAAVARLRSAGVGLAVVTNQAAIARGVLTRAQVDAVNARVGELLGLTPAAFFTCPHSADAGCGCRKPGPELVLQAAAWLGVTARDCAVVGDIGSDVGAALAAGARGVLVPTPVTLPAEVAAAPEVARDLLDAVDRLLVPPGRRRVLVARLDNDGDVLLAGPAVRAVAAAEGAWVTLLVGPRGAGAARLLPGVDEVLVWHCPWIDSDPLPVDRADVDGLVDDLASRHLDEAVVLTSFHQSSLPLALLLRLAGVARIAALSEDYAGSLLDVRHRLPDTVLHEVERALSTVATLGHELPVDDDGGLALAGPLPAAAVLAGAGPYVVVHPGASVPARTWSADRWRALVAALVADGHRVVVTGAPAEAALTAEVAGRHGVDLGGRTTLAGLAGVLAGATAVVVGNTGPAHLAAAVRIPVVSLFAPTVPSERWAPYATPLVLLGDREIGCAGCRARVCPVPGHPCLGVVSVDDVRAALARLASPVTAVEAP